MAKILPLREILDEEIYRQYEPHWSDIRMTMGYEPLPKSWAKFCEKMGWTNDNKPA